MLQIAPVSDSLRLYAFASLSIFLYCFAFISETAEAYSITTLDWCTWFHQLLTEG